MISKARGAPLPLSVVIPVRNRSSELRECLAALLKNDLSNAEILIVDDASEEAIRPTVELCSASVPIHYHRLSRHSGPGAVRNRGLSEIASPWVLFLDGDVLLPERSLEWIRESLHLYSHREDVVGVLGTYAEELPWNDFVTNFKNLVTCYLYRRTDTLSPYVHTPILCIQRELLQQAGGFETQVRTAEDFRLGLRLGSQGYRFVIDRRVRGLHLRRYTLGQVLREDWRRICDLRKLRPNKGQRKFYYQAMRWNRLVSLFLPGPILMAAVLIPWYPATSWLVLAGLLLFLLSNLRFLGYARRYLGWIFSIKAALFLFVEMLWAEIVLFLSLFQKSPG